MKAKPVKILFCLFMMLTLAACGSKGGSGGNDDDNENAGSDNVENQEVAFEQNQEFGLGGNEEIDPEEDEDFEAGSTDGIDGEDGQTFDVASSETLGGSNRAQFNFDCDLGGEAAKMEMIVELLSTAGVTWGPGPNPSITGVIGTGEYTVYVAGVLYSSVAVYSFFGENQYADFAEQYTGNNFRVQWVQVPNGLTMIVNPFGPGPTQYQCQLTGSQLI